MSLNPDLQTEEKTNPNGKAPNTTPGKSDEPSRKTLFDWTQAILLPSILFLLGAAFTWSQFAITNKRQDSDSAHKDSETKATVLTDYAKSISELLTKNNLGEPVDINPKNAKLVDTNPKNAKVVDTNPENAKVAANGLTFIALRRLNAPDELTRKNYPDVDKGELKGYLIRYLYDSKLIAGSDSMRIVNLSGADITNVVLDNAPLPKINLTGAWLKDGSFKKANLNGASLSRANLVNADFTNTDLRNANLSDANLSDAKLRGACYVEGQNFPRDFRPDKVGMKLMDKDKSNPDKNNFERCQSP